MFRHKGRILATKGHDRIKHQSYYRPQGGGSEFGELASETVVREIKEEIGAAVTNIRRLGVLENRFTLEGIPGHEIVFVHDAELVNASLYTRDEIHGVESDGATLSAGWVPYRDVPADHPPIYPDGLLELLSGL